MGSLIILVVVLAIISTAHAAPFLTPKAAAQRYWQKHVSTASPMPELFLNKASPLSASDYAFFSHLAEHNSLSSHLPDLCRKANLICSFPPAHPTQGEVCISFSYTYGCNVSSTSAIRGVFFREAELKPNAVMPMPNNVTDKITMTASSFLPRSITSHLPFSAPELSQIFNAAGGSRMSTVIANAVSECLEPPSPGETKRCVASVEDMIDFATSVLGRNVAVRAMEASVNSVDDDISLKSVKPINGGNAVSCHRRLFPYSLYLCHAIPNVKLYKAEIVVNTRKKMILQQQGTAICHLDTSSWSPGHPAFMALGSQPGKIEVCHWIFGDNMIWTAAD